MRQLLAWTILSAVLTSAPSRAAEPTPGLALAPQAPTRLARAANTKGLAALRGGDVVTSIDDFTRALTLSPTFLMSRYNLACAEARAAAIDPDTAARATHLDTSAAHLEALLTLDLYTFAPRWAADPDLAALRTSPHAARLDAQVATLHATYREAVARGVPGLMFDRRPTSEDEPYDKNVETIQALRAGVYDPIAGRFFATTPPDSGFIAAHVDREHHQTLLIGSDFSLCTLDFCPRLALVSARLYALPPAREPIASRSRAPSTNIYLNIYQVALGPSGAWMEYVGGAYDMDEMNPEGVQIWDWLGTGKAPSAAPPAAPNELIRFDGDARGVVTHIPLPAGMRLEKGVLTTARGAFDLGYWHRRITNQKVLVAPDGKSLLVVSNRDTCVCSADFEGTVFWSGVSRVDLVTRQVTHIQHQEASATADLDAAGAVYLQIGANVERWPSIAEVGSGTPEVMPAGFVLESLPLLPDYICCGL